MPWLRIDGCDALHDESIIRASRLFLPFAIEPDKNFTFSIKSVSVHRFRPVLARLDVHPRHDRAECYAMSFYTMGQVWARGSTFRVREKTEIGPPKIIC